MQTGWAIILLRDPHALPGYLAALQSLTELYAGYIHCLQALLTHLVRTRLAPQLPPLVSLAPEGRRCAAQEMVLTALTEGSGLDLDLSPVRPAGLKDLGIRSTCRPCPRSAKCRMPFKGPRSNRPLASRMVSATFSRSSTAVQRHLPSYRCSYAIIYFSNCAVHCRQQ